MPWWDQSPSPRPDWDPPTHPGIVFNDVYAASKFAVEGFCESLVVQALRFNVA